MHSRRRLPGQDQWGELYPFAPHWLELDGAWLHYVDEGDPRAEQTLLFVHGNPTWSFYWRRLITRYRGQYRCVAPDHLGCGMSDLQPRPLRLTDHIENLVRLIEVLDLRRVTLVAQDWGGAIGLGAVLQNRPLAGSRPNGKRFERLILSNTGAFRPWFVPWRIRVCRWPVVGRLAVQGANAFSRAALRMTLARSPRLPPQVAAAYLAPHSTWVERSAVYQFVRDIPLSQRHPTWRTLAEVEAVLPSLADLPTLLLWGMRDWCFTPACLDKFIECWPEADVVRLDDVGHWVLEDAPEDAERAVGDFLARTARPVAGVAR